MKKKIRFKKLTLTICFFVFLKLDHSNFQFFLIKCLAPQFLGFRFKFGLNFFYLQIFSRQYFNFHTLFFDENVHILNIVFNLPEETIFLVSLVSDWSISSEKFIGVISKIGWF